MSPSPIRLVRLEVRPSYRLQLTYSDGAIGEVDLAHLVGKGVFCLWTEPGMFERVVIGTGGELHWSADVELCADSLYLEMTGKPPGVILPGLTDLPVPSNA